MKPSSLLLAAALFPLALSGCNRSRTGAGFYLPPGDAARGRDTFVALKCHECHRVDGVADLPEPTVEPRSVVVLGGEVSRLRSYGDLVTSIIHPDQSLSEKGVLPPGATQPKHPMKAVNDRMTVAQLVDLVTFLHPHYREELRPLNDPMLFH